MSESIKGGDIISVHYSGRFQDGVEFDSTREREPFKFIVGAGHVVKGFDEAVVGMKAGDKKTITLSPARAYGVRQKEYVIDLPKASMPHMMTITKGMQLKLPLEGGRAVPATVVEVFDNKIRLDANHPMAGKTLVFDIEIVETDLTPQQLFDRG
ncbi:MAG: peptidylprolyl isomerase [Syntrophotaleaceae bacterium]